MKKANAEPVLQEFGRNFDGLKFRKGLYKAALTRQHDDFQGLTVRSQTDRS